MKSPSAIRPKTKVRSASERMQQWRKTAPEHARRLWRKAYWRSKGLPNYDGIAHGGMETPQSTRQRAEHLKLQLHRWALEYYVQSAPSVSDSEYDAALAELKGLEEKHKELDDPNSPTKRVGAPVMAGFDKVRHRAPMLSLAKAKTVEEVVKFFGSDALGTIEPKLDGISLALRYHNGRLVQGITRGDGRTGEEITYNVRTIRSLPLVLSRKLTMEVRGEAFMRWSDFTRYNEALVQRGEEPKANPRNTVSGAMRLKHSNEAAEVPVSFLAYQIAGDLDGIELKEQTEALELLEELGFHTSSAYPSPVASSISMFQHSFSLGDAATMADFIKRLDKARTFQDFPTDGLVFKVNSLALQQDLGYSTTTPRWALAFKYPPERAKTKIEAISWTVGKTGKVTPVAALTPVLIGGTTVSNVSLCNAKEIARLNVNVGDAVLLEKSNEIIPKIVELVAKHSKGPGTAPKQCPSCSAPIRAFPGFVDSFCVNESCRAQAEARLVYATGKSGLDIDGCGPATVAVLFDNGLKSLGALLACRNFTFLKPALNRKMTEGIKRALSAPHWRKLASLCIDSWGKEACVEAAAYWPSLTLMIAALDASKLQEAEVTAIKDKETRAQVEKDRKLMAEFGKVKVAELEMVMCARDEELTQLFDIGFFPEATTTEAGSLAGKTFCITGSVENCRDRSLVEEEIRKRGGLAKGSVSRKVTYLVVGNEPGQNKIAAAKRWGTECISADQLFDMMDWRPIPASEGQNEESEPRY